MKITEINIVIASILLILCNSSYSQGSWEKLDVPATVFLKSVCFVDSLYGWAAGDSGTIIHTQDGGDSWSVQESGTDNEVFEVFFLDRDIGWVATYRFSSLPYGTDLLKTTNGGEDWMLYPFEEDNIFITSIFYFDTLTGWMGGRPHALVKTTDGGTSWSHAQVDTSTLAFFPVLNISFFNENIGYACGGIIDIAGVIWYTYNGGEKWTAIDPSYAPADEVYNIHIFDSLNVIGAGGDPDFGYGVATIRTYDGGESWEYAEHGVPGNAFDIAFRTPTEAWCPLGVQRKFVYSLDAGDTWAPMNTPDSVTIYDIVFPDTLHGFAVGQEGAVLRYIPPVSTAIQEKALQKPEPFLSIFPNPVSGAALIKYFIPGQSSGHRYFSELKIFNNHARQVRVLVSAGQTPGEYSFLMDRTDDLTPGIYYAVLKLINSETGESDEKVIKFIVTE